MQEVKKGKVQEETVMAIERLKRGSIAVVEKTKEQVEVAQEKPPCTTTVETSSM